MFDLVPPHHQQLRAPIAFADKQHDGRLYMRQPHTVIQLVEVAAPPRRISSVIDAGSAASSSYSSSSSSSSFDDEEEMEEEEESVCSSYCSSDDFVPEQQPTPSTLPASDADAFARKMKRILLWRAHSEALPDSSSLKRKLEEIEEPVLDDDNVSQSSKRSRSSGSSGSSRSISSSQLDMHPCPACDAGFATLQGLRLHGQRGGSEACCVAVEYALES